MNHLRFIGTQNVTQKDPGTPPMNRSPGRRGAFPKRRR